MVTTTFNPQDEDLIAEREEAEKRALAEGERLLEAQAKAQQDTYDKAREADAEQARYAGKYRSAEDLEKAYLELQKKLGERSGETPEPSAEASEEGEKPAVEGEEGEEEAETSEVYQTLEAASKEFDEGNGLSDETLEKLSQLDSRTLIDNWVEYVDSQRKAAAEPPPGVMPQADVDRIMSSVGGTEQYQQMVAWASEALGPNEIAAYDAVVTSGNPDAVYWAVQGLRSKYVESFGVEGKQVSGSRAPRSEPGFRSQAELARAISDPRYRDDPAYRMDVEQKLARSGDLM